MWTFAPAKRDHTVPEVAQVFQCSPATVTNWIKSGRLRPIGSAARGTGASRGRK